MAYNKLSSSRSNSSLIGKEFRKIRVDRDERLIDMADKLGISAAFLSAVERGRKTMPGELLDKLKAEYELDTKTMRHLWSLFDRSKVTFQLNAESMMARDTAGLLARRFGDLSDSELESIRKVLKRGRRRKVDPS